MRNQGYIYTLLTVIMVMLILSITLFYFRITKPRIEDTITNIRTDELYYLINAMKEDYYRSSYISAQRAVLYAQNEVVENQTGLAGYAFNPCPPRTYSYSVVGSQSAIAELMLCGTFGGQPTEVMVNNTLDSWINRSRERASEIGFNLSMNISGFKVRPLGPFKVLVLTNVSVSTLDRFGNPVQAGGFSADAVVPIDGLSDPLYYLYTGDQALLREFSACNSTPLQANQSHLRDWLDSECYLPSSSAYDGPSFFDRLDGRLSQSDAYREQAVEVAGLLNDPQLEIIGLESLVNLHEWQSYYGVSINQSASWVDYLQWSNVRGDCSIDFGDENYSGFRLDAAHALKYYVDGALCEVWVSNNGSDSFEKSSLLIPERADVKWINRDDDVNHTLLGDNWCFTPSGRELEGYGTSFICDFTGQNYDYSLAYYCGNHSGSGSVFVSPPLSAKNVSLCNQRYYCGINTDGVCVRDFNVPCSLGEDVDCVGPALQEKPFYADGGTLPKHRFSGIVRVGVSSALSGTPVRVNASTGDYWTVSTSGGGSYSIDISFDNASTGFDEGTGNGASLSFFVSGHPVTTAIASSGAVTNLNLSLSADACVPGAPCTVGGCSGSWYQARRNAGVGHDSCSNPYWGCVRSTGVGYFDQVCCASGNVTQI